MADFDEAATAAQSFIFALYDRKDKRRVTPLMEALSQSGCRLKKDDLSAADERARRERTANLREAALTLLFASKRALEREAWGSAVTYCIGRRTSLIVLYLDEARGEAGIEMQLSTVPSLRCADYKNTEALLAALKRTEGFTQSLLGEPQKPVKPRWMRFTALALLGLSAIAVIGALFAVRAGFFTREAEAPQPTPPPGIAFADAAVQSAVCASLGKADGEPVYAQELAAVNELTLSGVPATLDDLAMLTALRTLRVPQGCVPLCAPLLANAPYIVIVEGAP